MLQARLLSLGAPLGFVALAAALAAAGAVPLPELLWAVASVLTAFAPSGWVTPAGWQRRAAEALLLPAAIALTMVGDPTMRQMVVPPLLVLAAWGAAAAALVRTTPASGAVVVSSLAVAVRLAGGLGLTGEPASSALVVLAAGGAIAWGVARLLGPGAGVLAALAAGALPLQHTPLLAAELALAVAGTAVLTRWRPRRPVEAVGWIPAFGAGALVASGVAAWGGLPLSRLLPDAGWPGAAVVVLLLVLASRLAPGVAGALTFAATFALGPTQPAPPDIAGFPFQPGQSQVTLTASDGRPYLIEMSLANAAAVSDGTAAAVVEFAGRRETLLVGRDTAEWAHERAAVRALVAHSLPARPVWRPTGSGRDSFWGVTGRVVLEVPAGVAPVLTRALPETVGGAVATAGSARATPPRSWELPAWLLAAALTVVLLQLATSTWRGPWAAVPWTLLAALAVIARLPVEPLHLIGERHAIDVALAAVLAAWLPAARVWLAARRTFLAAAVPLMAFALATPQLTPPMYGDEPFHLIVLDSLARDWDLDLANNLDLEGHPYNRIYVTGKIFLHSPVLAMLLLPGYSVLGRSGALLLLALAAAGLVALVARRAALLGLPASRVHILTFALVLTYPLATFATQIWVEVLGALVAAAALVVLVARPRNRVLIPLLAALVTAVKTRLALFTFPLAVVAYFPRQRAPRELRRALLILALAIGAGLSAGWLFLGGPLGYRRLADLLPHDLRQPLIVLAGLAFDPAGGLAFTAPLLLLSLAGIAALWRRGENGERMLLLGLAATVLALLHSLEWYGGGAPPARYLVPALPALALAGAMLLKQARCWRGLLVLVLPPSLLSWWVLLSRPHFSINPGDGGYWLADALARRFAAGARHLFPSFLHLASASVVVPAVLAGAALLLVLATRNRAPLARALARVGVGLWLGAAAALVVTLHERLDLVVEIEEPQVARLGGAPEPPEGTFSRFTHRAGWRVASEEGVEVPLNLAPKAQLTLQGWLEGMRRGECSLLARWDDGEAVEIPLARIGPTGLALPTPAEPGHHRLRLTFDAPPGGEL
ncbi:MAG: hypothetical protein V1750_02940, partial [Acidobacteriota bacterium]